MVRVVIGGVPRSGKTTMAEEMGGVVWCTDDVIDLGWTAASEAVSKWFDDPRVDVVEGCAAVRGLRKWLLRGKAGLLPCRELIWLDRGDDGLTNGQRRMAWTCRVVFGQIRPQLEARGVEIR